MVARRVRESWRRQSVLRLRLHWRVALLQPAARRWSATAAKTSTPQKPGETHASRRCCCRLQLGADSLGAASVLAHLRSPQSRTRRAGSCLPRRLRCCRRARTAVGAARRWRRKARARREPSSRQDAALLTGIRRHSQVVPAPLCFAAAAVLRSARSFTGLNRARTARRSWCFSDHCFSRHSRAHLPAAAGGVAAGDLPLAAPAAFLRPQVQEHRSVAWSRKID